MLQLGLVPGSFLPSPTGRACESLRSLTKSSALPDPLSLNLLVDRLACQHAPVLCHVARLVAAPFALPVPLIFFFFFMPDTRVIRNTAVVRDLSVPMA